MKSRPYGGDDDFIRIREFLIEVLAENDLLEHSWHPARLDYWKWHVTACGGVPPGRDSVFLWETPAGRIAAVLNPEGRGDAFIQIHPCYRSEELEEEIISTAERVYMKPASRQLRFMVFADDALRTGILSSRGYRAEEWSEQYRRLSLEKKVVPVTPPAGYAIRGMTAEDVPSRSWASWRAFHPDEPDEDYDGHDWYGNIEAIPAYRRDLDLVAIDGKEEVAAFCTVWFDAVTGTGYLEPVGRKPEARERNLMRSLLTEGAARLQKLGGKQISVAGSSFPANVLYASVLGNRFRLVVPWSLAMKGSS